MCLRFSSIILGKALKGLWSDCFDGACKLIRSGFTSPCAPEPAFGHTAVSNTTCPLYIPICCARYGVAFPFVWIFSHLFFYYDEHDQRIDDSEGQRGWSCVAKIFTTPLTFWKRERPDSIFLCNDGVGFGIDTFYDENQLERYCRLGQPSTIWACTH